MKILTCSNQIRVDWVGVSLSSLSLKLLLSVAVLVTLIQGEVWAQKPPLLKQQVPCLMVWLINFLVLVPLWDVGQQFGLASKSDGFFCKKVPKLCRVWMGRFAMGRLRCAEHIMQSRACNMLQAYSTTSYHVHLHK